MRRLSVDIKFCLTDKTQPKANGGAGLLSNDELELKAARNSPSMTTAQCFTIHKTFSYELTPSVPMILLRGSQKKVIVCLFYRERNQVTERQCDLPEVTQPGLGLKTPGSMLLLPKLLPLCSECGRLRFCHKRP